MDKGQVGIGIFTVIVIAIFAAIASSSGSGNASPREVCVQHAGLGMHIHPVLSIMVDNAPMVIPANIGIEATCMKALHTHDETGTVHIEYPEKRDFVLGDFFANWGQPFSKEQILDKKADEYNFTITVDGQPNTDFENLKLGDEQQIVIKLDKKAS